MHTHTTHTDTHTHTHTLMCKHTYTHLCTHTHTYAHTHTHTHTHIHTPMHTTRTHTRQVHCGLWCVAAWAGKTWRSIVVYGGGRWQHKRGNHVRFIAVVGCRQLSVWQLLQPDLGPVCALPRGFLRWAARLLPVWRLPCWGDHSPWRHHCQRLLLCQSHHHHLRCPFHHRSSWVVCLSFPGLGFATSWCSVCVWGGGSVFIKSALHAFFIVFVVDFITMDWSKKNTE